MPAISSLLAQIHSAASDDLADPEPDSWDRAWWQSQQVDGFWCDGEVDRSDLRARTQSAFDRFFELYGDDYAAL
jgi:hypothetical protein